MLNSTEEILEQKLSEVGILSLRKDDILTFEPKLDKTEQTLVSMKTDLDILIEWADGKKYGFLVDSRRFKKFNSDARVYAQKHTPLFAHKYAIIISSGTSSFLANLFLYMNRPSIPTKTFTTKDSALNWLKNND
jgi:hypothetical protein